LSQACVGGGCSGAATSLGAGADATGKAECESSEQEGCAGAADEYDIAGGWQWGLGLAWFESSAVCCYETMGILQCVGESADVAAGEAAGFDFDFGEPVCVIHVTLYGATKRVVWTTKRVVQQKIERKWGERGGEGKF
jgi:hypothetical protein